MPRILWRAVILVLSISLASSDCRAANLAINLPGDRAFPESISAAPDGTLYIGSLASGGVLRAKPGASWAEPWIAPGAYGSRSIFGVLADRKSQTLWVCSNDVSALGVPGPGDETGSALIGFDLNTGQGKIRAKLLGAHTLCNDIAVAREWTVYVTNSAAPEILKLNPQTKQLEVWLDDPQFQPAKGIGLDGIAIATDGTLYVDTYTEGKFFRISVDDGKAGTVMELPTSRPLVLADALRPIWGDAFLLIEGAGRLDRVTVEGEEAMIDTIREGLHEPTGVARAGTTTWVSEGQLSYLFDPIKKKQKPSLPFRLVGVTY
jgi:streptogramin lyase